MAHRADVRADSFRSENRPSRYYVDGMAAALRGEAETANPHSSQTYAHDEWRRGWRSGERTTRR